MLICDRNNGIRLTRGDSASISLELTTFDGEPYVLPPDDRLVFSVKSSSEDIKCKMQKDISSTMTINFSSEDTIDWDYGSYWYDVVLYTSKGEVNTVITPTIFVIMEEVHNDG